MKLPFNQEAFSRVLFFNSLCKRFALIKYGGGIVQMSGSIAGNTYARNRYGNYARARTKPVNPNSTNQQAVRAVVAFLTTRWAQTLTAVQRAAWNLYGTNVAMKNRLGESIFLTGFNHYIRSNATLRRMHGTQVDDGPTVFELPTKDEDFAITATEAPQLITMAYNDDLDWCDEDNAHMYMFQGSPQNAQRNFFDGPWRLFAGVNGDSVAPPTTPKTQAPLFPIAEGQHQWCYARIQRADGRLSEPFRADVLVSA